MVKYIDNKQHLRNPKILGLLRRGCIITFPSEVILKGIPDRNFIETGMRGSADLNEYVSIDLYILNEEGLEEALKYEEFYADSLKDNDDEQEYKEEGDWQ